MMSVLHQLFESAAKRFSSHVAVQEKGGNEITYERLDELSGALRNTLIRMGLAPGDRVGIYLPKSIDSVAAILGVLRSGAAYVPVDADAPASRNAFILSNCTAKAIIVERPYVAELATELNSLGANIPLLPCETVGGGRGLEACIRAGEAAPTANSVYPPEDSLAYILYTSGSTGKPKGVKISHGNALSFVHWCNELLKPVAEDRFSSHAPFHFDLSILDIYTPLGAGARLVLIDSNTGKNPAELAEYVSRSGITVWYSAPSILTMLAQFGDLDTHDYRALRIVLFAGEVFPVTHLRKLKEFWARPVYFNLYGPTETNVCTFFKVPEVVSPDRTAPYPIGKVCGHLRARVADEDGQDVSTGLEGELCIRGPSVTTGYWELPEQTAAGFLSGLEGESWYRTGDLVYEDENSDYIFVGRRDRMVKRRGNRVELGEVESCLYQHPAIIEVAVVATTDSSGDLQLVAHLASKENQKVSMISLKTFCAKRVPKYMIPDVFRFHPVLPKTSTDKIDYQSLAKISA